MEKPEDATRTGRSNFEEDSYERVFIEPPTQIELIEMETDCRIRLNENRMQSHIVMALLGGLFLALLIAFVYGLFSDTFAGLNLVWNYGSPILFIIIGYYLPSRNTHHDKHNQQQET